MAQLNFGGVIENVMTREEFPLEKAREILKDETIAVIGYGVQGPGQACNLRDNGFNVIVGQRQGKTYEKAVADGWVPGETLFSIEDACQKGTIVMCLLSDAAVMSVWPTIKPFLTPGKALYFSHGFAITWSDRTGVVPPTDIDVIMVAPKGSGTSLRTMFLEGRGLNSSYAIYQDATRRKWAVHPRGGEPKIFDYADVLQCEVAEAGDPEADEAVSKQEFAQRILANPAKAAKMNAAKRNMCLGMGVVVAVQTGKDEVFKLEIPVMTDEVKRDSSLYKSYRNVAEKIKAEFDAMGGLV